MTELAQRDRKRNREIKRALAPASKIDPLSLILKYDLAASWNSRYRDNARLLRRWWSLVDAAEQVRIDERTRRELKSWMRNSHGDDAAIIAKFDADLQIALRALLPSGVELLNLLRAPAKERKKSVREAEAEIKRWLWAAFRIPKTKENPEEFRHREWADLWINGLTYEEIRKLELTKTRGSHIELEGIKKGVWRTLDPVRWTL